MAETKTLKSRKKGRPAYSCEHFKMSVMKDQTADTIKDIAGECLDPSDKRNLLNTYHHVDDSYLQNYLDEFTYKLNRRHLGDLLFERLLITCISFSWCIQVIDCGYSYFIITPDSADYQISKTIRVCSLPDFLNKHI